MPGEKSSFLVWVSDFQLAKAELKKIFPELRDDNFDFAAGVGYLIVRIPRAIGLKTFISAVAESQVIDGSRASIAG